MRTASGRAGIHRCARRTLRQEPNPLATDKAPALQPPRSKPPRRRRRLNVGCAMRTASGRTGIRRCARRTLRHEPNPLATDKTPALQPPRSKPPRRRRLNRRVRHAHRERLTGIRRCARRTLRQEPNLLATDKAPARQPPRSKPPRRRRLNRRVRHAHRERLTGIRRCARRTLRQEPNLLATDKAPARQPPRSKPLRWRRLNRRVRYAHPERPDGIRRCAHRTLRKHNLLATDKVPARQPPRRCPNDHPLSQRSAALLAR